MDGDMIHAVKSGQTLWQIAISYEVKIDDIRRLNILPDNNIYPGDKLLIKKVAIPTPAPPLETPTLELTVAIGSSPTIIPTLNLTTAPTLQIPASQNNNMTIAIIIIALAILGGGVFTWLGSSKSDGLS
jgi:LysM repeat protein